MNQETNPTVEQLFHDSVTEGKIAPFKGIKGIQGIQLLNDFPAPPGSQESV